MKWWIALFVGVFRNTETFILKESVVSGSDMRENTSKSFDPEMVYNISKNIQKKRTLEWLLDPNVNVLEKTRSLSDNEIHEIRVSKGGLFDQWLFDMEKNK
jgi:hypothetical protein